MSSSDGVSNPSRSNLRTDAEVSPAGRPFVFPSPLRVLAAIVYAAIAFLAGFWLFESFQFYARATSVSLLSMFLLQTVLPRLRRTRSRGGRE